MARSGELGEWRTAAAAVIVGTLLAGCTAAPDTASSPRPGSNAGVSAGKGGGTVQPLRRVVVSTPGDWTDLRERPVVAPPREALAEAEGVGTAGSASDALADRFAEVVLTIRGRLVLMDERGGLLAEHVLPPQDLKAGETRRLVLPLASAGTATRADDIERPQAEVAIQLVSVGEGRALLRLAVRTPGSRDGAHQWMARLDGFSGQTFQAAGRSGRVKLEVRADGIPLPPLEQGPATRSVLDELKRPPPAGPTSPEPRP
ncbi:MAG: hypothetical protein ACK4PI_06890 [Tepidisphaerales bacterium]